MKTVVVNVEYSEKNLSAYIDGAPIFTVGNNLDDVKSNITEAIDLYLEDNLAPLDMFIGEYELQFKIDIVTFLNYYSNIFTKAALSRITGINERQLWHYAAGVHKPRKAQLEKIQKGIVTLTKELDTIVLN
ncbi:MAG: antitoxin HicB [Rikenellaceae bacterium]